jgi:hypothetical protein
MPEVVRPLAVFDVLDRVAGVIAAHGRFPSGRERYAWRATCPACGQADALTVTEGETGEVVVGCPRGCERSRILAAVGLEAA